MRTQQYLAHFLENNGYQGKVVTFSGTNNTPQANKIYQQWREEYQGSSRITGSAQIDKRSALIDHFKDHAEIMIATEAAAEGVNLQFCSLLINYDLPWNPQRIEQRIGRCHRYGQKFDVVVINFLNQRNQADQRVLELLTEKFSLFDGVFGASDSVLGSIENGVDFEKRIQSIYESCRTPEEIELAFERLQKELEDEINLKMQKTQEQLLEHFDEDIHDILKIRLDEARERLDKVGRWFWAVTCQQLKQYADFDHEHHRFTLRESVNELPVGQYQLLRKDGRQNSALQMQDHHSFAYRINHPLGEYVIEGAKVQETKTAEVIFDYSNHTTKVSVAEQLKGQSGWLTLNLLTVDAFNRQQFLVFTAKTDNGRVVDGEACKRLFNLSAITNEKLDNSASSDALPDDLILLKNRQIDARLAEVLEQNNVLFEAERDKLEKWAEDMIFAAEEALRDTKMQIKSLKREARLAQSMEEQKQNQEKLKLLERQQKRQRMEIFDIEDEIADKRDELISALEERMKQKRISPSFFHPLESYLIDLKEKIMSKYNELVKKLKEIFQIDRPELDFGIYRILNARADEINDYLDNKLKAKIQSALADAGNANKSELEHQLQLTIKAATDAGVDPADSPKVQELKKQLAAMASGANEHENAVFSHLLTFFSRYYDNGDFISKRRYKGNTYAIPYSGEEVMLHWANKDQYYIKSGENFANYSFKLDDGRKVSFKLLAADTAKDNRKDNELDRCFVLIEPHVRTKIDEEGDEYEQEYKPVEVVKTSSVVDGKLVETEELVIHFEYKAMKKGTKQDALVQSAISTILADKTVQQHWVDLAKRAPTEKIRHVQSWSVILQLIPSVIQQTTLFIKISVVF